MAKLYIQAILRETEDGDLVAALSNGETTLLGKQSPLYREWVAKTESGEEDELLRNS